MESDEEVARLILEEARRRRERAATAGVLAYRENSPLASSGPGDVNKMYLGSLVTAVTAPATLGRGLRRHLCFFSVLVPTYLRFLTTCLVRCCMQMNSTGSLLVLLRLLKIAYQPVLFMAILLFLTWTGLLDNLGMTSLG